jgi:hypothetical protein
MNELMNVRTIELLNEVLNKYKCNKIKTRVKALVFLSSRDDSD